ncbi:16S rRNA (guanine(527)-N(7))-methyltransferase RsmG [Reinekea blandensis]|uniref:Ribosomal RNA small subunit methyltransferase G n=1 Tax=Reinekea blandensis MED297 TaxID=314283 RepID=A4B9D0_9GAMM|nr:16S rRNA (guanine(527)-N(7))-methyltransferase RsmG [Reinekea blandensis]EAR11231.1 methyltransferase GidB [Reinekea sp. MED297] [Reinekea blandensis MED297]
MSQDYKSRLHSGAVKLGVELTDAQLDRLLAYHALLVKWNKAYNLTSVRDAGDMVDRHLVDSLSILPALTAEPLLDVGTGPGLPGMIIALLKPDVPVFLLDSNGKKTRFLNQVKMSLNVENVTVVHHRLESWQPERQFEQITSRAFATLSDMVSFSRHLLADHGRFIAMKGLYPQEELEQLPSDIEIIAVSELRVPGTSGARHLVELGFSQHERKLP